MLLLLGHDGAHREIRCVALGTKIAPSGNRCARSTAACAVACVFGVEIGSAFGCTNPNDECCSQDGGPHRCCPAADGASRSCRRETRGCQRWQGWVIGSDPLPDAAATAVATSHEVLSHDWCRRVVGRELKRPRQHIDVGASGKR